MLEFRLNISGKVIHGPDCGEQDNLDDATEVRTVGFREAAEALILRGYALCERVEPPPKA